MSPLVRGLRGPRRWSPPVATPPNFRRRRVVAGFCIVGVTLAIAVGPSLGSALSNQALGASTGARFAEWARTHGGNGIVNWIENVWYSHHQPPVGGRPPAGALTVSVGAGRQTSSDLPHLPVPPAIVPLASPAIPGEGQWSPAGRTVGGLPAVYETRLRPDPVHTSVVVGVAWMDTRLLRARLYSGSFIPGGGPFTYSAPVSTGMAATIVAAFNAGFQMPAANGGYYTDGKVLIPLRSGAASMVIRKDGTATVAQWGRDATMSPNIVSVRQNLDLLVDHGRAEPALSPTDTTRWGATLGNQVYVWRSGIGTTANGALVYVGGPGLNVTTLADLLVRAGATRAMELDINTDWVHFATYSPSTGTGLASPTNGSNLLPTMVGTPTRYFTDWWSRDFFTMSAVSSP